MLVIIFRRKVTPHNQRKLILNGYYFAIIIVIANILNSYFFSNIYIFILLNALVTIGLAFVNITTASKAIDLFKEGFATGNAVIRLVKFTVAGIAGLLLSFLSISKLIIGVPTQQLGCIVISISLFLLIKKQTFSKSAQLKDFLVSMTTR